VGGKIKQQCSGTEIFLSGERKGEFPVPAQRIQGKMALKKAPGQYAFREAKKKRQLTGQFRRKEQNTEAMWKRRTVKGR